MHALPPLTRDLVLLGGGHTHALLLRRWGMDRLDGVRLTLVNPAASAAYTGMLPGYVAGHYSRDALDMDLMRLARFAGARLVLDRAEGIDRAGQRVLLSSRPPIRYDILSVDIGVTAHLDDVPGFAEHAYSVKPLGPFAMMWDAFVGQVERGDVEADCAVIGGGVAGVEVALAMAHRLDKVAAKRRGQRGKVSPSPGSSARQAGRLREDPGDCSGAGPRVRVIEASGHVLPSAGPGLQRAIEAQLQAHGVEILTGARPSAVTNAGVMLGDGTLVPAGFVVSAAGARAQGWLSETGLALSDGFIDVDRTLRSMTDPRIFAVGDCAHMRTSPRPKAGVYAVRQAPVLHHNLRAALAGGSLKSYRPQRDYLKIISTGRMSAVAEKFGIRFSGPWLWRVKDRIDQAFMDRFRSLPAMDPTPASGGAGGGKAGSGAARRDDMLCGGCGAKVSRDSLRAGLSMAATPVRDDIVLGVGDDAAILRVGSARQVVAVDHLRAFTDDPWMLAQIAAVHALGDIWAMGAQPQAGLLSVILPRMGESMQAATIGEITDAAEGVLRAAGADLVGGHTSLGAELTIGLTVTGLCETEPITLRGAQAGDRLILTKPLGTGVLLAGEMRGLARGEDVAAALAMMARPQSAAAAILAPSARAMTDVTGFGLAGHLMSMMEASGCGAVIGLEDVPVLAGVETLAHRGVRSTLWAANARIGAGMNGLDRGDGAGVDEAGMNPSGALGARADLLFDPQTAGGLLAAVPSGEAARLSAALAAAGDTAAVIGHVVPSDGGPGDAGSAQGAIEIVRRLGPG